MKIRREGKIIDDIVSLEWWEFRIYRVRLLQHALVRL